MYHELWFVGTVKWTDICNSGEEKYLQECIKKHWREISHVAWISYLHYHDILPENGQDKTFPVLVAPLYGCCSSLSDELWFCNQWSQDGLIILPWGNLNINSCWNIVHGPTLNGEKLTTTNASFLIFLTSDLWIGKKN